MWLYKGTIIDSAPEDNQGFVYCITNKTNGRKYIGKKNFWTVKKMPPLKGKTNKRHRKVETDWRDYMGSSELLLGDVNVLGKDFFQKEILKMCKNKTTLAYWETKLQFDNDVLLRDDYYNQFIGCRITAKGLRDVN